MNSSEIPEPPSLSNSPSENASVKIIRSKRTSSTYSKIFPSPSQDSSSTFRKSNSSAFKPPHKSKTKGDQEARLSSQESQGKRFSGTKGRVTHFEAYEKTFNPHKILSKKDSFFSSAGLAQQDESNSAKNMTESVRSGRRQFSKKITPTSGFGLSSIGRMDSSGSISTPDLIRGLPGLQNMRLNSTPDQKPNNLRRIFHFGSNRDGFKGVENKDGLSPISPPANQFSFKVIHPQKVEQDTEEPEVKKSEDNEPEPVPLDKNDAAVQAISASSSEISEEGDDVDDSDDSFMDSLIEDNPYDVGHYDFKKSLTLRTLQTHIRDSRRYAGIKFILFPDDKLKQAWDLVIVFALLYTALIMPIRLAFIENPIGWVVVDWIIDGTFAVDICMNFLTAYFDAEDNLITSRKKIFKNYILGWFIIDITCIFPFQVLSDSNNSKYNSMFKLARLPRLYRLLKIVKLVRMVKVIRDEKQFQTYMKDTVNLGPAYERLLLSVGGMVIFCHVLGCIWFILVSLISATDSWISIYSLEYASGFDQYIASLYFVIQTVVTVGYGDMTPLIYEERLIACFFMVIGVLFYSVFIGFLSSLVSDIETLSQKFSYKMRILTKIKNEYGLSLTFTKQLITAIKYENKQKLDYKHFISELPGHLAVELSFRMYYDLVCSIPFFQNRSKAFIAAIGPLLRPMKILKDEVIFMEGDPADEVFFIKTGKVAYVLPKFHNFKFLKVREGYFFGEVDLLFHGEIRKYCAVAVKDCEFYVLNKKDFKKIFLVDYRDIGTELYINAQPRKVRTRKVYKEALEICKLFQASPKTQGRRMSKQRLSLFRNEMQNAEQAGEDADSSEDSAEKETKMKLLPDIEEEDDDDFDHKNNMSPKTPLASLKKAITLRKGDNPFGRKSSFGEAIAAHKEKFADDQKLNHLSEKMETLEDQLNKVVKLTTALSKKLAQKENKEKILKNSMLSPRPISPKPSSPEKSPGSMRTVTIIKTQPKNLATLTPHYRFDFDEDFIEKLAPSTVASGSDQTVVQSVIISEGNPSVQRMLNNKDEDIK